MWSISHQPSSLRVSCSRKPKAVLLRVNRDDLLSPLPRLLTSPCELGLINPVVQELHQLGEGCLWFEGSDQTASALFWCLRGLEVFQACLVLLICEGGGFKRLRTTVGREVPVRQKILVCGNWIGAKNAAIL